jgi:hypothetical protein
VQIASGATLDLGDSSQSVAELGGSGLVSNGTIIVSGSIMPGGADSVGTLTLAATAISGSLLADVNTDGSSDLLAVQGNLDLAGLSISVANPALLSAGHDYTLITCTGTRTGTIASLTAPSGWYVQYAPDGSVQLVYSGGSLILIQ